MQHCYRPVMWSATLCGRSCRDGQSSGVGEVFIAGCAGERRKNKELLAAWPLPRKSNWGDYVNGPLTEAELAAAHRSVHRGSPFGDASWSEKGVASIRDWNRLPVRAAVIRS